MLRTLITLSFRATSYLEVVVGFVVEGSPEGGRAVLRSPGAGGSSLEALGSHTHPTVDYVGDIRMCNYRHTCVHLRLEYHGSTVSSAPPNYTAVVIYTCRYIDLQYGIVCLQ